MSRILTKSECLQLDIELYNIAMEEQWKIDKIEKNLSGNLSNCCYCGRKYTICCICDKAEDRWNEMIVAVQEIAERDRSNDF